MLALALATRVDRKTPAELIDYARSASQTLGTAYAEQLKTQPAQPAPTVITAQRATDTPDPEDRQQPVTAQPSGRPQSNLAEWTQQLTAPTHDPNDAVWATFTGEHPTTTTESPFIDRNENRQIRQVGPLHVVTGLFAPALLIMATQAETGIVYAITGLAGIIWAALAAYLVTRHRQPAT